MTHLLPLSFGPALLFTALTGIAFAAPAPASAPAAPPVSVPLTPVAGAPLAPQAREVQPSPPRGADFALGTPLIHTASGSLLWIDSRLQLDAAFYQQNRNALANGALTRRATFALKATFFRHWSAELDVDFAEAKLDLRDLWVMFRFPWIPLALQAGNFKEPFGLEYLGSSRLLTFVERSSIMDAFVLGRRLGAAARTFLPFGQATLGIFGQKPTDRDDREGMDEQFSVTARLSAAPLNRPRRVIHLGLAGSYKVPDAPDDFSVRLRARPETRVDGTNFANTGDIADVDSLWRYGAELAAVWGPLLLQGELLGAVVKRLNSLEPCQFWGGYATLAWVISGESRTYVVEEGEFAGLERPRRAFGAFEVAARFSHLVLTDRDAGVVGGTADQLTLGLNWYAHDSFRVMLDYSFVFNDDEATGNGKLEGGDRFSFVQLRLQAHL